MARKKDIVTLTTGATEMVLPAVAEIMKAGPDEQMNFVTQARQFSSAAQAAIGQVLQNLKSTVAHGEFTPLLEKHGWSPRTARHYMEFAAFAEWVAKQNPEALPLLDMSRWTTVRKELDDQALIEFVTGKEICGLTLNDAQDKTSRELKFAFEDYKRSTDTTITKLQKQNTDLTVELDTQRHRNKALQERIGKPFKNSDVPQYLAVQRHESHNLAETVLLCLDELDGMVTELEQSPAALSSGNKHLTIAVNSLYTHVNALYARAQGIVQRLYEGAHSELIEHTLLPDIVYTEEEALAVLEDRALMVGEHNQEKAIRENQRESAKPRGRGRPKKAGK